MRRLRSTLDTSIWLIPSACLLAAVGLSFLAERLDASLAHDFTAWYLFRGGPEGAREVLSTIASSMMTFTGVVFSVTVLVLQLASNQFSPRVLRTFLRDRGSQAALGIFVGTFAYALLGLRSVRGASDGVEAHVPAFTVWLAVVLAGACVCTFIYFLHHVAQSIRAVNVLSRIGDETRERLDTLYPEPVGEEPEAPRPAVPQGLPSAIIPQPRRSGVVVAVDEEALWRCACRAGVTLALVPRVGDFVPQGGALFEVWGDAGRLDARAAAAAIAVDDERDLRQDVAFGLRQLVDVAERALSPGVNDPTTAVQALDQLHDLLRRLAHRRFPSPARVDAEGRVRLLLPRPSWEGCVRLALDEIRQAGEGATQVTQRLRFLLEDLLSVAPPARRPELLRQRALLEASVRHGFADARDQEVAFSPDPQGHGSH
nr:MULTISPECIES: DUF2254 domain-containing protein [Myxococcaceae]